MSQGHRDSGGELYAVVVLARAASEQSLDLLHSVGVTPPSRYPALLRRALHQEQAEALAARLHAAGMTVEIWSDPQEKEGVSPGGPPVDPLRPVGQGKRESWVLLVEAGDKKIQVIKEIRAATGLGLKESKDMVDNPPVALGPFSDARADHVANALLIAGATCELVASNTIPAPYSVLIEKYPTEDPAVWPRQLRIVMAKYSTDADNREPTLHLNAAEYLVHHVVQLINNAGGHASACLAEVEGEHDSKN